MSDITGIPDIIMVWPTDREIADPPPVAGFSVRVLPRALDSWWVDIHRKAVTTWKPAELRPWLERYRSMALPNGILLASSDTTNKPVCTAGSIANSRDGMFPGGGQLAWVATIPDHRNRGLATWLSALATQRLIKEGHEKIFLCTGEDMTQAIRVYLTLGYLPCLYAPDQHDRWARICDTVEHPFKPKSWPTLKAYVSG